MVSVSFKRMLRHLWASYLWDNQRWSATWRAQQLAQWASAPSAWSTTISDWLLIWWTWKYDNWSSDYVGPSHRMEFTSMLEIDDGMNICPLRNRVSTKLLFEDTSILNTSSREYKNASSTPVSVPSDRQAPSTQRSCVITNQGHIQPFDNHDRFPHLSNITQKNAA